MNVAPMILRFCSGSVTSCSRSRNRSVASTNSSGSSSRSNRVRTCAASSSRSRPLSTKMQVSRSPIALCSSTAATVESTPPDKPADDAAVADRARESAPTLSSTNDAIVQSPRQPQTSNAKLRRICSPLFGVRDLRMEQQPVEPPAGVLHRRDRRVGRRGDDLEAGRRRRDEVAVAGPDLAATSGTSSNSGAPSSRRRRRRGRTRGCGARVDLPAERVGHELHAVADAERRRAEREHVRIRFAARPAPTRSADRRTG